MVVRPGVPGESLAMGGFAGGDIGRMVVDHEDIYMLCESGFAKEVSWQATELSTTLRSNGSWAVR